MVFEEAEACRCFSRRPCILLPGGHPTRYGVRQPRMAFEPHEGTNENTRRRLEPGSSDHQRKHAVWRSLPWRDTQLTGRLRSSRTYPTVYARTSHFKNSFNLHGVNKFQWLHSITNLHNCFCLRMIVWVYVLCVIQPTGCRSLIN